jgi:hypothetical protein
MKIVKVFKTDVQDPAAASRIIQYLLQSFSQWRINFDLDDCDRILRIESQLGAIEELEVQLLVTICGHHCEPLQD